MIYIDDKTCFSVDVSKSNQDKNGGLVRLELGEGEYLSKHDIHSLVTKHKKIRLISYTGTGKNTAVRDQFDNLILIEPTRLKCAQELEDYPESYQAFNSICTVPDGLTVGQIVTTPESFFSVVRHKINPDDQKHFVVCLDEMHLIALANYRKQSMSDTVAYLHASWGGIILMSGTDAPLCGEFFDEFTTVKANGPKRIQTGQVVYYDSGEMSHVIANLAAKYDRVLVKIDNTNPVGEWVAIMAECNIGESQIANVNSKTLNERTSQLLVSGHWPKGVKVVFATDVLETGINIHDNVDAVILANAPSSQAAEQTVNRFRRSSPTITYILYPNDNRNTDTSFLPDLYQERLYNRYQKIAGALNASPITNDLSDSLTRDAARTARQLSGGIAIDTDVDGREFYVPDAVAISQQIAGEVHSKERKHAKFFKRRMEAYNWQFVPDMTIDLSVNKASIQAVKDARRKAKETREEEVKAHCDHMVELGEIKTKAKLKENTMPQLFFDIAVIAISLLEYVTDWKTAVTLAKETSGRTGKMGKIRQALKTQQDRQNEKHYTLAIYALFGIGELKTASEYRADLLKFYQQDNRLRPYLAAKEFIDERATMAFMRRYFQMERRQQRVNGRVVGYYEIVDDSPHVAKMPLKTAILGQNRLLSHQNSYKNIILGVTGVTVASKRTCEKKAVFSSHVQMGATHA